MAGTKLWSELRLSGEETQTKCVLISNRKVDTLINGLRQMSHMTSELLSDLVEREKSSAPGDDDDEEEEEEEEEDEEDDEEEDPLKSVKEPPAKKTKNT
ncbi:protein phosphatase 1 regulatory subunit 1B [Synchiropus splendidus]|uniref:protein phosphatase 1 regulatory subunit 1B n=1 Tax=Synchiropus splendidus TaxID=270530 RepID=UPI00237D3DD0|nr:protein phosphatase 1 regulatory subunit 1B [Synchiropus splendidus]XP_053707624.1 protein phosphatase 1 regulatory subunit 1B [Synchiropus splendidus]